MRRIITNYTCRKTFGVKKTEKAFVKEVVLRASRKHGEITDEKWQLRL
jgi:hypothetical protein